jgi:P27 family predicted phage terminase small subunit
VWLTAYAAEVWDEIVPELAYMTIAKAGDAGVIAAYCEALARLRRATEDIAARGQIVDAVDGSGRQVANPSVRMADSASTELRQVARELGLTPSARSGIHVHHHQDSEPAARLLGG